MNSSNSANLTISSNFSFISRLERPSMMPLMKTFSLPEISGWKPAPSSIRAETFPRTDTFPEVGLAIPAMILSRVLLPDPFSPITPKVVPFPTLKLTLSRAVTNSSGLKALKRSPLIIALLKVLKRCRAEYFW